MTDLANLSGEIERLVEQGKPIAPIQLGDSTLLVRKRNDEDLVGFELEPHLNQPIRKRGIVQLTEVDSLVEYVNRHQDPVSTTLWADRRRGRVIAVLDDHAQNAYAQASEASDSGEVIHFGPANWGQHRALLQLQQTQDWINWTQADGRWMSQDDFAEFLEQNASCVTDAATMYEIATSLRAHKGAEFQQAVNVSSGEVKLSYVETITSRAGQKGELEVPTTFSLDLEPYDGLGTFMVQARFLYRINGGDLKLSYRLLRPQDVLKSAFDVVRERVADGTDLVVLAGEPRG